MSATKPNIIYNGDVIGIMSILYEFCSHVPNFTGNITLMLV